MNPTSTRGTDGTAVPFSTSTSAGVGMAGEADTTGTAVDPAGHWVQRGHLALDLIALTSRTGRSPFGLSFVRHIDVPYEACILRLTALVEENGIVTIGRSRLTIPAVADADADLDGTGRHLDVSLGRGIGRPRLAMDLEVVPWSPAFGSVLELHPVRGLRADRRYYREGNALLDRLTAVITGRG